MATEWTRDGTAPSTIGGQVVIEHAGHLVRLSIRTPGSRLFPFAVLDGDGRDAFIRAYAEAERAAEATQTPGNTAGQPKGETNARN